MEPIKTTSIRTVTIMPCENQQWHIELFLGRQNIYKMKTGDEMLLTQVRDNWLNSGMIPRHF